MSVEIHLLKGEVEELDKSEFKDVERLLSGFLKALLAEQKSASHPTAESIPAACK